jgi:Ser/Thr protein kinase RdoA (MazF antagonist)
MMATLHTVGSQDTALRFQTLPRFEATAITDWIANIRTALLLGLLTSDDLAIIEITGMRLQEYIGQIADNRQLWGPIHADLHHDNLLFYHDEVRPIDFDGLQIAPYYLDLGTTLYHIHYQGAVAQQALLRGYQQVRPLPDTCRRDLDAALICSAMGNLAFQITIPEQWTSVGLARNLRQLIDAFCRSFIAETPIVDL